MVLASIGETGRGHRATSVKRTLLKSIEVDLREVLGEPKLDGVQTAVPVLGHVISPMFSVSAPSASSVMP